MVSSWDLRKEVVDCARRLALLGFMPSTSGNLSVRLDPRRVLITPSGLPKSALQPGQLDVIDLEGDCLECGLKPTSELGLHLAAYRLRPDVMAAVHAHPPAATAFACAGVELPADIASEVVAALKSIPLTSFFMPGSKLTDPEMPADLREALQTRDAMLLSNHGALTLGNSLAIAFQNMELLEHYAKICLGVFQLGRQKRLSPQEVAALIDLGGKYRRG
ncbi:MAG: class II aldolase/adducin family protein [Elusimicrobia bacterium]|nr:class II aldolase/adducin family protein [Elusimicrobiota bacterium]